MARRRRLGATVAIIAGVLLVAADGLLIATQGRGPGALAVAGLLGALVAIAGAGAVRDGERRAGDITFAAVSASALLTALAFALSR